MKSQIKGLSKKYFSKVLEMRRHLHQHPELSFKEWNTQQYILDTLSSNGIECAPIANTGVLALIVGTQSQSDTTFALRGDMDALPIHEENQVEYASVNAGVMHACGHDVHTSSLIGTALILQELRSQFSGTVKLLFQPGEEVLPGGATKMIGAGALQNPQVEGIFGQHVYPELEAGKVGFRSGQYMAACDEIHIEIKGQGGHAALPHKIVDTVYAASQVVVGLHSIMARNRKPDNPSLLSIGKFVADGATNVIPNQVKLEGTLRTFDEDWRKQAHSLIKRITEQTAAAFGAEADVEVRLGYPHVFNDPNLTENAKSAAIEYLGQENVVDLDLRMTGEDFAFYSHQIPGCFYRLGTKNKTEDSISGLHTPTFNIDESSLETSIGLMAWLAIRELEK